MPSSTYTRVAVDDEHFSDGEHSAASVGMGTAGSTARLGTLEPAFGVVAAAKARGLQGLMSCLLFSWARPVIDAVPPGSSGNGSDSVEDLTMGLHTSLESAPQVALLREHQRRAQFDSGLETGDGRTAESQLTRALHGSIRRTLWLSGLFRLLAEVANLSVPVVLQWLVESLAAEDEQKLGEALVAALLLAFVQFANVVLLQQFIYGVFVSGGQITTSLTVLIFEKGLLLPSEPEATDKLTNLMAKDAAGLRNFVVFFHNFWAAPLSVLGSTVLLLRCLGWPALVGIALIPALIPIEKRLAAASKHKRKKTLAAADDRMAAVRGAVECIEVLKLDPERWESRVEQCVWSARDNELHSLRGEVELVVKNQVMMRVGPLLVAAAAFSVHVLAGHELTPATAFAALALFSGIGHPFHVLPKCISLISSARASIERISSFLQHEEVPPTAVICPDQPNVLRTFRDMDNDVTVHIKTGVVLTKMAPLWYRNLIVGKTGSGKTLLLRALIGEASSHFLPPEVDRLKIGSVKGKQRVAYCPSSAWLVHDTIRANILIGRDPADEFDAPAYKAAVAAVALEADLFALPDGDMTVLGMRGSTVSGGQRARIALARAVYSHAEVYVLDEPLVSLDVATAKHCFQHAIRAMRQRGLVVMASSTPTLEILEQAESIHIVRDGNVVQCEGQAMANEFASAGTGENDSTDSPTNGMAMWQAAAANESRSSSSATFTARSAIEPRGAIAEYLKACKCEKVVLSVVFSITAHLLFVSKDIVLSMWSEASVDGLDTIYLTAYVGLCVAVVGVHWLRFTLFFKMALRASKVLHSKLFAGVARSPLPFFETTPPGDITARFAGDMDAVDAQLPAQVSGLMDGLLSIVTGLTVVLASVPLFICALPSIIVAYWWVARRYRGPAKALKALDNQSKEPLWTLCSETLEGIATVRAYGLSAHFCSELCSRLDANNRARYSWDAANRWLSVRLELVGAAIVGSAALAAVCGSFFRIGNTASRDSWAGLAITSALFATRSLSYTVRSITGLEQQLNALQRIVAFAQLEPEPNTTKDLSAEKQSTIQAVLNWPPRAGDHFVCEVELDSVVASYCRSTSSYPQHVALDLRSYIGEGAIRIEASQRVGVCGRSGSGKSTLAKVLCRALNPADGVVRIGGIDTGLLPLERLRSTVCVVPQAGSVGDGRSTIRSAIDPASQATEQQLWRVLTLVGLQQLVSDMEHRLDTRLDSNFLSAGELQLLLLARAVYRHTPVLILDEVSAHLDEESAQRVRDLLCYGDCFDKTTIIVIAHSLMDLGACERVLVFDSGRLAEDGTPTELLHNDESLFHAMFSELDLVTQERLLSSVAT